MSITVSELKAKLENTIGQDYINEGFGFNKSKFSFKKNIGKSQIKSLFLFNEFKPERVEYTFTFSFFLHEIETEKKKFYAHIGKDYSVEKTIHFFEGDFHPKLKNESSKIQRAFTHKVYNIKEDVATIDESRLILKDEFFTRISIFTNLKLFQDFILNDYGFVLKYQGYLIAFLIASKLRSEIELKKMIDYVWEKESLSEKDERYLLKQLITSYLSYTSI